MDRTVEVAFRRNSEETPFVEFYERMWGAAVRWATGLTTDPTAGEDIAQDAFVRVRERFAELENPEAYLRRSVVNLAKSTATATSRRRIRELRAVPAVATTTAESDIEALEALRQLPFDQRAALVLRYWTDWPDDAIATALGCRPATVRSHILRARNTLRSTLREDQ